MLIFLLLQVADELAVDWTTDGLPLSFLANTGEDGVSSVAANETDELAVDWATDGLPLFILSNTSENDFSSVAVEADFGAVDETVNVASDMDTEFMQLCMEFDDLITEVLRDGDFGVNEHPFATVEASMCEDILVASGSVLPDTVAALSLVDSLSASQPFAAHLAIATLAELEVADNEFLSPYSPGATTVTAIKTPIIISPPTASTTTAKKTGFFKRLCKAVPLLKRSKGKKKKENKKGSAPQTTASANFFLEDTGDSFRIPAIHGSGELAGIPVVVARPSSASSFDWEKSEN